MASFTISGNFHSFSLGELMNVIGIFKSFALKKEILIRSTRDHHHKKVLTIDKARERHAPGNLTLISKETHELEQLPESRESYTFKISIGGAGGVGKTTLLHRYLNGVFLSDSAMTIGVSFHTKEINRGGSRNIRLSLWDLGGQERFRFLHESYLKGTMAGVVFFDMTRIETATQVKDWVWMFRKYTSPDLPIVLGGTKLDVVNNDIVVDELNIYAMEMLDDLGLQLYVPTSSKTGEGVDAIFTYIVDMLLKKSRSKKKNR